MRAWGVAGVLVFVLAAVQARAEDVAGLPAAMWDRVHGVQPRAIELTVTPSPPAPARLSLKECVDLAFRYNGRFRSDQDDLLSAMRGLWVADQRVFYTTEASAQRNRPPGASAISTQSAAAALDWQRLGGDTLGLRVDTLSQTSFRNLARQRPEVSLTYDRPILRGAGLAATAYEQVRRARVGLLSAELAFYDSHQALAVQVIEQYFATLEAQAQIEIARRRVDRAKRFYDQNYVKFTGEGVKKPEEAWVSRIAEIDVDQARLAWEQAQQDLIASEQAYRDAMDALLLRMGLLPGSTPELTTAVQYAPQAYDGPALVETGLRNSTALAALNLSRDNAAAARRIAYSAAKPDLIASFGLTDLGQTGGAAVSTGWLAGLTVQVPFWNRGLGENKASADRALRVLDQQIVGARDSTGQQVRGLVRAAESAKARIAIGEESLKLAQKNREQAQGMFEEGVPGYDYLRVLDADARLVQAERSLLEQKVAYYITSVRIRQALGENVTQGLPE